MAESLTAAGGMERVAIIHSQPAVNIAGITMVAVMTVRMNTWRRDICVYVLLLEIFSGFADFERCIRSSAC